MAIEQIRGLSRRDIHLKSLTGPFLNIETSSPMGETTLGIIFTCAHE
jgi:putative resolvase